MNNPKYLVLLTIVMWSFGSVLTRLISINSPLLSLNLLFFFTFITFLVYALIEYKKDFIKAVREIKPGFVIFGLFGYFFYYLGLTQSFHLFNSASETTILNYSFPIFTVLFTEVTLRKLNKKLPIKLLEYLGIGLGFLAISILATQGNILSFKINNIPALLWGLSAAIAYGLFSVYSSKITKQQQTIFLLAATASSWFFAFIISLGEISQITQLPFFVYIVTAISAFIVNGIGYIAWTRANRLATEQHVSISSIASLLFILPVISLSLVSLLFKETKLFQPYFLLCLVLLLISTLLCQKSDWIFQLFKRLSPTNR